MSDFKIDSQNQNPMGTGGVPEESVEQNARIRAEARDFTAIIDSGRMRSNTPHSNHMVRHHAGLHGARTRTQTAFMRNSRMGLGRRSQGNRRSGGRRGLSGNPDLEDDMIQESASDDEDNKKIIAPAAMDCFSDSGKDPNQTCEDQIDEADRADRKARTKNTTRTEGPSGLTAKKSDTRFKASDGMFNDEDDDESGPLNSIEMEDEHFDETDVIDGSSTGLRSGELRFDHLEETANDFVPKDMDQTLIYEYLSGIAIAASGNLAFEKEIRLRLKDSILKNTEIRLRRDHKALFIEFITSSESSHALIKKEAQGLKNYLPSQLHVGLSSLHDPGSDEYEDIEISVTLVPELQHDLEEKNRKAGAYGGSA